MASADTENAGGVHAIGGAGSAPGGPSDALESRIDELLKDAEQKVQPFEHHDPVASDDVASGDVLGPPIDEPFDLAKLSTELESALRQAEDAALAEREAERQIPVITPEAIVAVAVSATTEAGAVGPDGEALPLIDLEALDHALAQAADAVGFGIGGIELEIPRAERIEQTSLVVEAEPAAPEIPAPSPSPEPVVEQVMAPTPMMQHAKALANASAPPPAVATELAPAPVHEAVIEPVAAPVVEPQVEAVQEVPAQIEVVEAVVTHTETEPASDAVPAPEPAPAPKRAPAQPAVSVEPKPNPVAGAALGVLRAIASPLTVMSPAVRDLVGWLGLLTAFNAACVWVFVMLIGPGNWPTASAHASPASHKESAGDAHGSPKPAPKNTHDSGHGAPAKKKDAGHGTPSKKDGGHGAPAKKPAPHAKPKEKKKGGGHGGH